MHILKWKKPIIIFSLILNVMFLLGASVVIYRRGGIRYIKYKIEEIISPNVEDNSNVVDTSFNNRRINIFNGLDNSNEDIYFVGDSLIDTQEWNELFNSASIRDRGIGGDTTDGLLKRIDEVIEGRPKKVFIMVGINDILTHTKTDIIQKNYKNIIDKISSGSKDTEIYCLSVLPTSEQSQLNYKIYSSDIENVNEIIKQLASENDNSTYIDLYSSFTNDENYLNEDLSFDGVHINSNGYDLWKELTVNYVNQ